jgi:hypothetical protein
MSEQLRAKFDVSAKEFLDCSVCQNYYVITLTKFPKAAGQGVDDGMFQNLRFEDLKGNVRLVNDKNDFRELVKFVPATRPGESAVLFFQRKDANGNVLISSQNKEFALTFSTEFLQNRNNPYSGLIPRRFEFKTSKLMMSDQIAF